MKINIILLSAFLIFGVKLAGQKKLPVIKAVSENVDIKVDGKRIKNAWTIVPEEKLDVYTTSGKKVTFYTDSDSISYNLKPGSVFDFIILKGKDSARTQIKYEPSRLDILKNAGKYNFSDDRFIPKFAYQSQDNADLKRIRKDLKLDSIAGNGSELSKIFNLMHWVHNLVRHDGSSNNPTLKNAIDLIRVCKTENRGVNCRMLATILNECYLSLGIKSRYITCMPKETQFDDCHVINMVYSSELNKWIWIDPTFDAYVMDDKGNLLGIQEVRERLVKGLPLVLNADANRNRNVLQTKEEYLENYMAKNLYRLETPVISQYDSETWKNGKSIEYVELLPLDGLVQEPQKKMVKNNQTGVTFTNYKTNNPDLFWTKP
ncbi:MULTISPECIES: transglutaminase-like domain-containing protein [unclassified Chryseobacterium]|uniref:transglutaminase-like domain-containing protein n=1 Tax=unclassified Chryseobacterium TaxID=2593645 RepID=UPI000D3B50D6|nr:MULTISPECIES: transglutaminase-like domain-containing protein [unclassified Chryseobacterium]PTT72776.1 transglutaminase domain-containing protein [Chryseobacterium sp. HMWF001]PVV55495.1 transglutaminase domain-containing protein [Chryseobacterium sp. HMWF035]